MDNIFGKIKKRILKYVWYRQPIKYAKWLGVRIGDNSLIISHPNWGTEPYLISIGSHTEISFDCTFLTHDGGTWLFRDSSKYKNDNIMKFGAIHIGDNSFIGCKSIIMPGVTIGNNCIIAAGSVVTKKVPDNEVWGGVPAHFILKTDEYYIKCKKNNKNYDLKRFNKDKRGELTRLFM